MKRLILLIAALLTFMAVSSCSSAAGVYEEVLTSTYGGNLENFFRKYENAPHRMGAQGPDYFDCSGFVRKAYREVYGIELPRTSQSQYGKGSPVKKSELKYGDLVFFNIYGGGISHVGIYTGNNTFIHASTKLGVTKSDLKIDYYSSRYAGARRILR